VVFERSDNQSHLLALFTMYNTTSYCFTAIYYPTLLFPSLYKRACPLTNGPTARRGNTLPGCVRSRLTHAQGTGTRTLEGAAEARHGSRHIYACTTTSRCDRMQLHAARCRFSYFSTLTRNMQQ
jgi:hypothetical protein